VNAVRSHILRGLVLRGAAPFKHGVSRQALEVLLLACGLDLQESGPNSLDPVIEDLRRDGLITAAYSLTPAGAAHAREQGLLA